MEHTNFTSVPELRRPVMVMAFEGWNDAGEAASTALDFVAAELRATTIGQLDPEEFYDFQQTRPTVRRTDDGERRVDWPTVELQAVLLPEGERDLVLLRGHEPNLRWRTFTREILDVAGKLDVELVVTVGALLADVPHTRPAQITGTASDTALARSLGMSTSRYEGPTGILGVLGEAAHHARIPAVNLWAALPHYLQTAANPQAALTLTERLRDLLSLPLDTAPLADAATAFSATIDELMQENPELVEYVQRLEEAADEETPSLEDLPPEELVAEVERFLRDHPDGPNRG